MAAEVRGAGEFALQQVDGFGALEAARQPWQRPIGQKLYLQRFEFLGQFLELVLRALPILTSDI
jgi:hypothetical protein